MTQPRISASCDASGMRKYLFSYDPQHSNRRLDFLTVIAVGYITLPNLIFIFGWLQLPLATILGIGIFFSLQQLFHGSAITWHLRPKGILIIVIAAAWCFFGGAGHFGYANVDWLVRDAVYGDLIHSEWPPAYTLEDSSSLILRSAFGYFLLPSLVSSYSGIATADISLYIWTVIGTAIFLSLLPIDFSRTGRALLLSTIVIMFSGMDILGILMTTGEWPLFPLRLEWWTAFSYSSLSGQLFWAPNHCIPIWIGTALFYRHWATPSFLRLMVVFAPLTLIWTPFAIIALIPFLLFYLVSRLIYGKPETPGFIQLSWALIHCAILTAFLTFDITGISTRTGATHVAIIAEGEFWGAYLHFVTMEFVVIAMLLSTRIRHSHGVFITAVLVLLALPFVFFGPSNDLLLRVSIPALLVLAILSVSVFDEALNRRSVKAFPYLLLAALIIGACTPFNEIYRAATWKHSMPDYRQTLLDTQSGGIPAHYLGRLKSTNFLWFILKSPKAITPSNNR